MYHVRISLGIALLSAIAGLLWLDLRISSGVVIASTLAIIAMPALREFYAIAGVGSRFLARVGTLGGGALLAGPWLDHAYPEALGALRASEAIPASLLALIVGWALACGRDPAAGGRPANHTIPDLAWTAAGLGYVVYPLSCLLATKGLPVRLGCGGDDPALAGIGLVLYLIVVAKSADIGGYLVGKPFGKHKLIPRISPNKSWEGALGGLALSVVVALALARALPPSCALPPLCAALFGAAMAPLSLGGDLLESYLKRWAGVKDSGSLIPTYGGMLDMIDSLSLCAPVGYLLLLAMIPASVVP